jgi:two-component system, OmpR family, sensor histidine kinase BaeS
MISFHSLRWKLIGSYLLLVAAVLVAVVVLTRFTVSTIFATYQENSLVRDAGQFAHVFGQDYNSTHDWHQIAPAFNMSTQFDRNDIWILNMQGAPVLTQPANAPANERPSPAMLRPVLQGQVATGQINGLLGRPRRVWAAVPLRANDTIIGAVFIVAAPETALPSSQPYAFPFRLLQTTADFVTDVEHRLALIGGCVGILAIGLGVWLARSITDPIQDLRRAVGRIASGDLTQRVRVRSRDEVGGLAADINRMAERLEADVNELHAQEELRRDLVANVSHDLATPLTGIQGFTEALMDGMVGSDAERRELYSSIYREVHRLRRLVGDLQDLSSLENGMGHIEPHAMHLEELLEEALSVEHVEAAAPLPSARGRWSSLWKSPSPTPAPAFPPRSSPISSSASTAWTVRARGKPGAAGWDWRLSRRLCRPMAVTSPRPASSARARGCGLPYPASRMPPSPPCPQRGPGTSVDAAWLRQLQPNSVEVTLLQVDGATATEHAIGRQLPQRNQPI